ncbi:hypothetical protein ACQCVK_06895 [Rossellomorea vietnamensis]|uniref:hypothetical protein n=1 Tax=Rossellomorea vietnamensis TaxID=218284 RepID=UPI003CEFCC4A
MMHQLAEKLQPFIEGNSLVKIVEDEFSYNIVLVESGEVYGFVHIEEGRFLGFQKMESEEVEDQTPFDTYPNVNKMLAAAKLFADSFIDRDVHFSMLNEWSDNSFMVTYEERDPKMGLQIPHTGFTLFFTRDGILTSANTGITDFQLEYPEITLSNEEAKQVLKKSNYVQLDLHIPDESGTEPELIYRSSHDIMSVGVDGRIERVTEFIGAEELSAERISIVRPASTIEEMLGISEDLKKRAADEDSVIWIHPAAEEDEEAEPVISIVSNETGYFSYSNLPFEMPEDSPPLAVKILKEKALEVLELVEGKIHEKFVLEVPMKMELTEEQEPSDEEADNIEEEEEDLYPEPEPTQMFTFYREHQGYRLEGLEAHVHVGLYTGLIRECSVTRLSPEQTAGLEKLNLEPAITLQEAEERVFRDISMKLARCVKNFDDERLYTLCYMVDFPETGGHIEKINAHTGAVSFVETGILKESD